MVCDVDVVTSNLREGRPNIQRLSRRDIFNLQLECFCMIIHRYLILTYILCIFFHLLPHK